MIVSRDLATLREWITDTSYAQPGTLEHAALDRVEAEIARLERKLADGWDEVVAKDKARAIKAEIRAEAAEAEVARLRTGIARQLTPLDVATAHIQIIRSKGDEYTAEERDNVAAIVEAHTTEARSALFSLITEDERYGRERDGYRIEGGRVIPTDR